MKLLWSLSYWILWKQTFAYSFYTNCQKTRCEDIIVEDAEQYNLIRTVSVLNALEHCLIWVYH